MRRGISMLAVIALAGAGASRHAAAAPASKPKKVSKPFEYSGYSRAQFKGVKVSSYYVPISDGAKLAAEAYLPSDGPPRQAFPVILEYTP